MSKIEELAKTNKIQIDLSGEQGNSWILIGFAAKWADQMDLDSKAIVADMLSKNYFHLLDVFEKHFSGICTLINRPKIVRNKRK